MKLGNYEAWIECEGRRTGEYQVEVEGSTVTCWIPSEAGKSFTIIFADYAQRSATAGAVFLDGTWAQCPILIMGRFQRALSSIRNEDGLCCPMQFTNVQLTDDEALLGAMNTDLGTIKLELKHVVVMGKRDDQVGGTSLGGVKVHEQSKKMASHCISLGRPDGSAIGNLTNLYYIDNEPRVTFLFRYRKKDILIAHDIMPPDPRLPRVFAPKRSSPAKPEVPKTAAASSSSIKGKGKEVNRKRAIPANAEVIDLCGDDDDELEVKRVVKRVKREPGAHIEIIDLTSL